MRPCWFLHRRELFERAVSRHLATVRELMIAPAGLPIRPDIIGAPETRLVVPPIREGTRLTEFRLSGCTSSLYDWHHFWVCICVYSCAREAPAPSSQQSDSPRAAIPHMWRTLPAATRFRACRQRPSDSPPGRCWRVRPEELDQARGRSVLRTRSEAVQRCGPARIAAQRRDARVQ